MENKNNENNISLLREIQIAKLEFIGLSITTLGDGFVTIAAGLALNALENPNEPRSHTQRMQLASTYHQLEGFIEELKEIKSRIEYL